jgi:hypothetical protein
MDEKDKQRFFNKIKHGSDWHSEKIVNHLSGVISNHVSHFGSDHSFRWDSAEKYNYLFDNDCYLFVEDDKIVLRSDRENVFSSNQTIEFPIRNADDVEAAYEKFLSMTMEDNED